MSFNKKIRIPKFTVGSLLAITAAVAAGLAVSLSPPKKLELWEADMRWQQGLMCVGGVLLAYELIRQAILLVRKSRTADSESRTALIIAISQRLVLAALIFGLLIMQILLSRLVIIKIQRVEYTMVYIDFWPDLMLTITLLAAIRILLIRRVQHKMALTTACVIGSVIFAGMAGIAFFIFTDRAEDVALTHFATEAIEKTTRFDLQRTGFFPNHRYEGFRSFWFSATASIAMVLAAVLLWLHVATKRPLLRIAAIAAFLLLILCAGIYVSWFVYLEFPRISPDLASAGTAIIWSDAIAWLILLIGIAATIGLQLARVRNRSSNKTVMLPSTTATGSLAIFLIVLASGWESNVLLCQWTTGGPPRSVLSFLLWFLPLPYWSSWQNYIYTFGEAILQPEILLTLMLFVSAISLARQHIRQPDAVSLLPSVAGRQVVGYTLLSLVLMIVAIPTFAIFGFCYWLGPIVL